MESEEDLWHVRMGPNEVKKLTLEKLDDLFRLDIIAADTLIWQPGMDEWLPLSVVAGLGEDEEPAHVVSVPAPPPRPQNLAATATSWPPAVAPAPAASSFPPPVSSRAPVPAASSFPPSVASRPPAPAASSFPPVAASSRAPAPPPPLPAGSRPPPSVRTAPPPPSSRPAPPSSRAAPPSSRAAPPPPSVRSAPDPLGSSWPPAVAWSNPPPAAFAPTVAAGTSPFGEPASLPSAAPVPRSLVPTVHRELPRSRKGVFVIALALVAGLVVTLYRNAVVHAAARSVGAETAYLKLEAALGGPGFGTPRMVQQLTLRFRAPDDDSADTAPASTTGSSAPAAAHEDEPSSEPGSASPDRKASTLAKSKAAAPAPRAAPSPTSDPLFTQKKKGKKGGASDYDPLNGSL